MIMKTIQQFAHQVQWGELDILLVDLPPGTGDAQLSLVQTMPLAGAIIVTTPQEAAITVARRGATLFGKVNVPLLGVAENMSFFEDANGDRQYLFGQGGGLKTAGALDTEFFGEVPLDPRVREGGDRGIPICVSHPDANAARAFGASRCASCKNSVSDRRSTGERRGLALRLKSIRLCSVSSNPP